jgi:hypothetical protein
VELYISMPLISFVAAGAGAFFGAYLKKKGENLATHEDINKLVAQVSAVTEATKQIEAKISNEVWDRQRLWEMKRDVLLTLVKAESAAKEAWESLVAAKGTVKGQSPDNPIVISITGTALRDWNTAIAGLDSARAQVSIVCEKDLDDRLDSIVLLMRETATEISKGLGEFDEHISRLAKERMALRRAIRAELAAGRLSSVSN